MTQKDVILQLLDGKWHSHGDIMTHNGKNIPMMYKRGELCKRRLFIPTKRIENHIVRKRSSTPLKFVVIVQYRLHPEWLEYYREKFNDRGTL